MRTNLLNKTPVTGKYILYGSPGYPQTKSTPVLPEHERYYLPNGAYIHTLDAYNIYANKWREMRKTKGLS